MQGLAQSADVSATPFGLGPLGGLSGLSSLGLGSANFMDLQQKMMREVLYFHLFADIMTGDLHFYISDGLCCNRCVQLLFSVNNSAVMLLIVLS